MGCVESTDLKAPRKSKRKGEEIVEPSERSAAEEGHAPPLKLRAGQFIQKRDEPIFERYDVVKQIGYGSYGKVFLAEQKGTRQKRAIKEINKPLGKSNSHQQFLNEVEVLSQLDHPNIVKIFELYEDAEHFYIVAEILSGGELFDYITSKRQLSEPEAAHIMYQVLSAVSYCHQHSIVHRDLKPENLLLEAPARPGTSISVKVIDFGTSCLYATGANMTQKMGTAYYIAPEVLEMNYNEKCDVWSCGVILYILLGGYPPFAGRTDHEILAKVKSAEFNFEHINWVSVSTDAKNLISYMLKKDFAERISASECLNHTWIQRYHSMAYVDTTAMVSSLNNLKTFHEEQRLKKAIIAFIAAQLVSSEQTRQLTAAFKALDRNGDGRLSRGELVAGYTQLMPAEAAIEQVSEILKAVDFDGDGYIEYSEFITGSLNKQVLLSRSNLELAFKTFDRDGSGSISLKELKAALSLVEETDDDLWVELIREVDQNGDGEIDVKEFTTLMLKASGQR
jgi:calcium-dependent protein kinase